ncbi:MAG: hypothetical protein QM784_20805 [Polyangiaceae bacterium]
MMSRDGIITTKLEPLFRIWYDRKHHGGLLVEHLSLVGRERSLLFRMGPAFWTSLGDHWDLHAYVGWPLSGPNHLGFWDGMYGAIGVMYRFATGDTDGAASLR